jgi:hypothetical protein
MLRFVIMINEMNFLANIGKHFEQVLTFKSAAMTKQKG